jgi:penicillin amidase
MGISRRSMPMALLGHNQQFGWSMTMFENDDMDLIAETVNPFKPIKVKINGAMG